MNAKDLERLLEAQGVSHAKMDGITRKLRESGSLPTGGRGTNAPMIGPTEAAIILIALAGSAKANEADDRVEKLKRLISTSKGKASRTLLDVITSYLDGGSNLDVLSEVRVSRTKRRAACHFRDGQIEEFLSLRPDIRADRFYVEGILSAPLLALVARALGDGGGKTSDRAVRKIRRSSGRSEGK